MVGPQAGEFHRHALLFRFLDDGRIDGRQTPQVQGGSACRFEAQDFGRKVHLAGFELLLEHDVQVQLLGGLVKAGFARRAGFVVLHHRTPLLVRVQLVDEFHHFVGAIHVVHAHAKHIGPVGSVVGVSGHRRVDHGNLVFLDDRHHRQSVGSTGDAQQCKCAVHVDEFLQGLHGVGRHVLVVLHNHLDLAAIDAAVGVDLFSAQAHAHGDGVTELAGRTGVGQYTADDDFVVSDAGVGRHCRTDAREQGGGRD